MKAKLISFLLIISILVPALSVRAFCDDVSDGAPDSGQIEAEYNPGEQIKPENLPESGCRAVYAADPDTGKVFYEKNAHEKMYPASTTKILTALLVLENCSLTEKAKVSQNALDRVKEIAGEVFNNLNIKADILTVEVEQNGAYIESNGDED